MSVNGVVYDAGVLVAADRNARGVWAEHRVRLEAGIVPVVPTVVVAQVSRSPAQVQLRRMLRGCEVVSLPERSAHAAGQLLGRVGASDVVDAVVAQIATELQADVVTGDRADWLDACATVCHPFSMPSPDMATGGGAEPRPAWQDPSACPVLFRRLLDDASLFPPASLKMAEAVAGHQRHREGWYREMSGPFVCPDAKIAALSAALTASAIAEQDLALVLPGGAANLDSAVDAVFADPRLRLRAVEVPVGQAGDLEAVADLVAALDRTPLAGATAFAEIPAGQLTKDSLQLLADHGYLAKLRTGGTTADAFPSERALATSLTELTAKRLAFKCTAGLHHAVKHRAAGTGFEHHGFLNVMLAVAAALDDASADQVAGILAQADAHAVAAAVADLDADTAAAVRELFTSFGTCSTDEPITDLVTLGLITRN